MLNEADQFLLDGLKSPEAELRSSAWQQLVSRYQGRLVKFAAGQLGGVRGTHDAEDLVQETFVGFISSLTRFRGEAAIETMLFTILRRRIIDFLRVKHLKVCLIADQLGSAAESDSQLLASLRTTEETASFYMRQNEAEDRAMARLAAALTELLDQYKQSLDFKELKIAEMLFYAQLRNKQVAQHVGMDEKQVALIKHRWMKRLKKDLSDDLTADMDSSNDTETGQHDGLITQTWEIHRLSCPKRSTLGHWLLGALDEPWMDYIDFHVNVLGCRFCQANLADIKASQEANEAVRLSEKMFESTIGFLKAQKV